MKTKGTLSFFATVPLYVEDLLASELQGLGALSVKAVRAGVHFSGTLETAYRACLWSRVASRILFPLSRFPAGNERRLLQGAAELPWEEHFGVDSSFAVDAIVSSSRLTHSHYAALLVKDGVADRFRRLSGSRPFVDTENPAIRINLHLHRDLASLSLDLSGESLHRRGYRGGAGEAPLKENAAAAMLLRAQWPDIAAAGGAFLDPLCGSGTLPIEAALMAADCPPGLLRAEDRFGFLAWRRHDPKLWKRILEEARSRFQAGLRRLPTLAGCDRSPAAVAAARANVRRAGLEGKVAIERKELSEVQPPPNGGTGLLASNPPYGERLGDRQELPGLYAELGRVFRERFSGWQASILTANEELARATSLRAFRVHALTNGALRCRLLHFRL